MTGVQTCALPICIVKDLDDAEATIRRRQEIRQNALDKLSDEEKEILNIKVEK